jgi:diguanylate cyclase (GGDEF)-like protein
MPLVVWGKVRAKILLSLSLLGFSCLSLAGTVPSLDVKASYENGKVALSGPWGLYWGEWLPVDKSLLNNPDIQTIPQLDFLKHILPHAEGEKVLHSYGYGTYVLHINHLKQGFKQPAIHMRTMNDAWQAWWLDSQGEAHYLGESGRIAKNAEEEQLRYKTAILNLPTDSDSGTLVIYISNHMFDRGGLYGKLSIQEHQQASRWILLDLSSRVLLLGLGLWVILQNLIFYSQRRQEKNLLLLAVFAFAVLMRSLTASDYLYVFIGDPDYFRTNLKLEYILIIWPAAAAIHLFANLFPFPRARLVVQLSYLILILIIALTVYLPAPDMMFYLLYYQGLLLCFAVAVLAIVLRAILLKIAGARTLLLCLIPLLLAVCNDVYATQSSAYNLFFVEHALFLFLFIYSQAQALRFVSALDTAEHLSNNLQHEIALKTLELSEHNSLLKQRALDLEQQRNRIKEMAKIDHLTGLYNRQSLDEFCSAQFSLAVKHNQPLSLIMLDLDNFKQINDTFGHTTGDQCLKHVATYLNDHKMRKEDVIARYGGEEMVIVLANTELETAVSISQRLCDGLAHNPLQSEQQSIVLTASFGIAERCYHGSQRVEDLINEADKALYVAKQQGKNCVVVAKQAS